MRVQEHNRYRHFAMIIVTTAIKEYRTYLRKSKKDPTNKEIHTELDLLEGFFRSSAYRTFSNHMYDGEKLINEIQKQEGVSDA